MARKRRTREQMQPLRNKFNTLLSLGWSVGRAAKKAGVSYQTGYRWAKQAPARIRGAELADVARHAAVTLSGGPTDYSASPMVWPELDLGTVQKSRQTAKAAPTAAFLAPLEAKVKQWVNEALREAFGV